MINTEVNTNKIVKGVKKTSFAKKIEGYKKNVEAFSFLTLTEYLLMHNAKKENKKDFDYAKAEENIKMYKSVIEDQKSIIAKLQEKENKKYSIKTKRKIMALKRYILHKLDDKSVMIESNDFSFAYTIADDVVKKQFIGQYRYIGGLQCAYPIGTTEYKELENELCDIAEKVLNIKK